MKHTQGLILELVYRKCYRNRQNILLCEWIGLIGQQSREFASEK
jgi:hypothetical protein